jgi:hypothetical protein
LSPPLHFHRSALERQTALETACLSSTAGQRAIPATEDALSFLRKKKPADRLLDPDQFQLTIDVLGGFLKQARPCMLGGSSTPPSVVVGVSPASPPGHHVPDAAAMSPKELVSGSGSQWDVMANTQATKVQVGSPSAVSADAVQVLRAVAFRLCQLRRFRWRCWACENACMCVCWCLSAFVADLQEHLIPLGGCITYTEFVLVLGSDAERLFQAKVQARERIKVGISADRGYCYCHGVVLMVVLPLPSTM